MELLSTLGRGRPAVLVLSALVLYSMSWIVYTRFFHPLAKIPGPWLASVSRVWYMVQVFRGDMEKTQRQLHAKHGPLLRIAPNEVTCSDPSAIKQIYRTQRAFDKTDFYPIWNCRASTNTDSEMFLPLKGLQGYRVLDIPLHSIICFDFGHANGNPSLFAMTSDKAHHQARRVVNHVYSLANVLKSEVYIDKCSELFLRRLREHAENAEPVIDLGRWLQMYAFDVIGELYFGNMFGFLEQSHDRCRWIQSLDLLQPFMCTSAVAPRLFQPLLLASSSFVPAAREAMKAFEEIGVSTRGCVAKRFELGNKIESEAHKRTDIMQQLYDIHLKKGSEVQFGMGEIEQEAYSAFFAGSDTTATGFRSIVYHLMKNREAYQQVQQEIDEAFEQGRLSEPVKFSETLKLPFLCATIKEALRIHPGVQLSMGRVVSTEGMVLCGSFIPGGYWVGMNAAVVQLDVSIFGHDADQFRPARWLEPEATNMDKHMLVFGAGTRTCIGKNISLAELHKLTPAILRHFDLELVEEHSTWKTKNYNLCKQDLGPVRLRRRLLR